MDWSLVVAVVLGLSCGCDVDFCGVVERSFQLSWATADCDLDSCLATARSQLEHIVPDDSATRARAILDDPSALDAQRACENKFSKDDPETELARTYVCDRLLPPVFLLDEYTRVPQSVANLTANVNMTRRAPFRQAVWRNARREASFLSRCLDNCQGGNCTQALLLLGQQRAALDAPSTPSDVVWGDTCTGSNIPSQMCIIELVDMLLAAGDNATALRDQVERIHRFATQPAANATLLERYRAEGEDAFAQWRACGWNRECRTKRMHALRSAWSGFYTMLPLDQFESDVVELRGRYKSCMSNCFRFFRQLDASVNNWRLGLMALLDYYTVLLLRCETASCRSVLRAAVEQGVFTPTMRLADLFISPTSIAEPLSWIVGLTASSVCCAACCGAIVAGLILRKRQAFQWLVLGLETLANFALLSGWIVSSLQMHPSTATIFLPTLPITRVCATGFVFLSLLVYLGFWVRVVHNDLYPSRAAFDIRRLVTIVFVVFGVAVIATAIALTAVFMPWFRDHAEWTAPTLPSLYLLLGANFLITAVVLGYFVASFCFLAMSADDEEGSKRVRSALVRNFTFSVLLLLSTATALTFAILTSEAQPIEFDPWVHDVVSSVLQLAQTAALLLIVLTSWLFGTRKGDVRAPDGYMELDERSKGSIPAQYDI
jgi:hypothetical protein